VLPAMPGHRQLPAHAGGDHRGRARALPPRHQRPRVRVSASGRPSLATRVSDVGSPAYQLVEKTIRQAFPDVIVAPYLVLGGTDAKHYEAVSDNLLRFLPQHGRSGPEAAHGTDERVGVGNYASIVNFYALLMQNSN